MVPAPLLKVVEKLLDVHRNVPLRNKGVALPAA